MDHPSVLALHELSEAIVAAPDQEAVREFLRRYEAGEIGFAELVNAVRELGRDGR